MSLGVRVNPLARAFAGRLETELRARLVTATATCDRAFEEARAELERFRPGAAGTIGETDTTATADGGAKVAQGRTRGRTRAIRRSMSEEGTRRARGVMG